MQPRRTRTSWRTSSSREPRRPRLPLHRPTPSASHGTLAANATARAPDRPRTKNPRRSATRPPGALWSVIYRADAGPIHTFVRAVRQLRWSNPKLTRTAQGYAMSLRELATLPLPNICADVRAWSASGFRTIPAATIRFDSYVESIEGHTISPRVRPLRAPGRQSYSRTQTRLETKLEHAETVTGFNDWDSLLETLGLNL